ncbi:MAG: RNA methyltransferase [Thermoanaerobaculia bacterium]
MSSLVRIVLVEPQHAGNVGAAARAMKNFGFSDLAIVGGPPSEARTAEWWASGADDLVRSVSYHASLQAAIADAVLVIATTSARGRDLEPELDPAAVARERATLGEGQQLALVFGREASGLTTDEAALCHRVASIPTNPEFPTMNLAQAVSLFCYELARADLTPAPAPRDYAPADLVERLHERAEAVLHEIGFLHEDNPDRLYDDLRALVGRARLDRREATILLGILRQLEWKVRKGGA